MTAAQMFELIGPRQATAPIAFQCGAPWTAHATDAELVELGRLQGRIQRRELAIKEMRAQRHKVMMRCVRRMRRERGVE